jgi:DMSO/TMAO reductase YedYZ molybdopterin-dependent catalytic subunit
MGYFDLIRIKNRLEKYYIDMIRSAIPLLVLLSGVSNAAQDRPHTGSLIIVADASKPLTLKPADLTAMPRTTLTVKQPDGRGVTYEGVLVAELLKRAGAPLGKELRGAAVASYVVASATDGYRVVFSLAELDPEFSGSEIMVVDRVNGEPLLPDQGPIRIFAPRDIAGARSIRMLERIEVVRLPKP